MICCDCKEDKPLDCFNKNHKGKYYFKFCSSCGTLRFRTWRDKNREKYRARSNTYYHQNKERINLKKKETKYNLTPGEIQALHDKQKGLCGVCSGPLQKRFDIDHNHTTGKVRGLLHPNCNTGLGLFKESITTLQGAIDYLNQMEGQTL